MQSFEMKTEIEIFYFVYRMISGLNVPNHFGFDEITPNTLNRFID